MIAGTVTLHERPFYVLQHALPMEADGLQLWWLELVLDGAIKDLKSCGLLSSCN